MEFLDQKGLDVLMQLLELVHSTDVDSCYYHKIKKIIKHLNLKP